MSVVSEEKARLRALHKERRQSLGEEEKQALDLKIEEKFLNSDQYKRARVILTYVSTELEVDTRALIDAALADKKTVAVPRCNPSGCTMDFYEIRSLSDLKKGYFGILEPTKSCKRLEKYGKAVCVVPGMTFDRAGNRIGYGKGYYDRFLAEFRGTSVGFCYSMNTVEELPTGEFDKSVDFVLTDRYTIEAR